MVEDSDSQDVDAMLRFKRASKALWEAEEPENTQLQPGQSPEISD
jgi:hypothetical protein